MFPRILRHNKDNTSFSDKINMLSDSVPNFTLLLLLLMMSQCRAVWENHSGEAQGVRGLVFPPLLTENRKTWAVL